MTTHLALSRGLRRFFRRADGSATVEFAVLFPIFMSFLIMGAEAGYVSLQRVGLDRAINLAVRDVRLDRLGPAGTHDALRDRICALSIALPDCETNLLLEMRAIDTQNWNFPAQDSACVDLAENITPVTPFSLGAGESVMYLRACYLTRPIFPTTSLGLRLPLDNAGMFALRATTGFVNE